MHSRYSHDVVAIFSASLLHASNHVAAYACLSAWGIAAHHAVTDEASWQTLPHDVVTVKAQYCSTRLMVLLCSEGILLGSVRRM